MLFKKRLLCAMVAMGLCVSASAQIKSEVNECFELTSIAFRLAGAEEYVTHDLQRYTRAVDSCFAPFKTHPLIAYCQEIRQKQMIGYDAISTAGSFIEIKNGKVISISGGDRQISKEESRWTEESFAQFVKLLNDFYKKSKFKKFFDQQLDIRQMATRRYDSVLMRADADWFPAFFGGEPVKMNAILSLNNGKNNYGFRDKNGAKGSVIGTGCDQNGDPYFSDYMLLIFVHEVLHGYVNEIVDKNWDKIQVAADEMFPFVAQKMSQIAYGSSKTTVIEWMVRLVTLCYAKDHPEIFKKTSIEDLVFQEQVQGFVWMDHSLAFMDEFNSARDKYKTFADFTPRLVEHINATCKNYEAIAKEYMQSGPTIVGVIPGYNEKFYNTTDKLILKFSEPMMPKHSYQHSRNFDSQEPYWEDSMTFVVPIDCKMMKVKDVGQFYFMPFGFVSQKGQKLREAGNIYFEIDAKEEDVVDETSKSL